MELKNRTGNARIAIARGRNKADADALLSAEGYAMEVVLLPGPELAQYGIATFAVAGLIFIVTRFLDNKSKSELAEVIKNNTKALEKGGDNHGR